MKRAGLLRRDSVHGSFQGTIRVDEENQCIIANGNVIRVIYASNPDEVDYAVYGISDAIIIDNTGAWKDEEGLSRHLKSNGASRVILTAPGSGTVKNIVAGINNDQIEPGDNILAAASCTTNAIVPVLKAVNDQFGIVNGHMETIPISFRYWVLILDQVIAALPLDSTDNGITGCSNNWLISVLVNNLSHIAHSSR